MTAIERLKTFVQKLDGVTDPFDVTYTLDGLRNLVKEINHLEWNIKELNQQIEELNQQVESLRIYDEDEEWLDTIANCVCSRTLGHPDDLMWGFCENLLDTINEYLEQRYQQGYDEGFKARSEVEANFKVE